MGLFDLFRKDKRDDVTRELEAVRQRRSQPEADPLAANPGGEAGMLVVDDVFSITGRGTVVTGTVSAGSFTVGDRVEVTRGDGSTAGTVITGIEAFRKLLKNARQGDQIGMLLKDLRRDDIGQGDLVRKV